MLVTGAGSVYGVGIIRALKASDLPLEVIAVDINPYALGLFIADQGYIAPPVSTQDKYYRFIEELCRKYQIKAVFIGSGSELLFFARQRRKLELSTGAKVLVSSPKVIKLCTDKWLTMGHLYRAGFQVPLSIRFPEDAKKLAALIRRVGFPLIVKPRIGRGSEGVTLVKDTRHLRSCVKRQQNLIIQEYLTEAEQEYTVGICLDRQGGVLSKVALKRRLQDGVSIAAISEDYEDIAEYGARVAGALGGYGAINVQLRLKAGKPVVFEVNPRFSSSTGMRLLLGVNEPESLLRAEVLGQEVVPQRPQTGLVLRQYAEYYFGLESKEHFVAYLT